VALLEEGMAERSVEHAPAEPIAEPDRAVFFGLPILLKIFCFSMSRWVCGYVRLRF
jgi:hypothetical protein